MDSEELFKKSKKSIPGGVNSPVRSFDPYPFFVESAEGSKIFDIDGNEYIDYVLGYGPLILGHNDSRVKSSLKEQGKKGIHFGAPYEKELKLAKKIIKNISSAELVRFSNSGTEATMTAIRLARGYTGKEKILMFDGGYHGSHDHLLFDSEGVKTEGIPKSLEKSTIVSKFNDIEKVKESFEKHDFAGVILEPVMGNSGCLIPEPNFLKSLKDLCEENGTLLIFDEVITGFRLSLGGAQKYFDVEPDLTTLGKIIGGGFPIGAIAGKKEIMNNLTPKGEVFHAGTFSGHPFAMTAGLKTLEILENENILENATDYAYKFADRLEKDMNYHVSQIGPMLQFHPGVNSVKKIEDIRSVDENKYMRIQNSLLEKGIFIPPSHHECLFISGAHSDKDLKSTLESWKNISV